MDGGIGEAALMSAVIGGGTAAITGGDPLKGALMGGLTGGVMGGLGGLSGVDSWAAQAKAVDAANAGLTGVTSSGLGALPAGVNPAVNAIGAGTAASDAALASSLGTNGLSALPSGVSQAANLQGAAQGATQPFSLSRGMDIVKANPWTYGGIAASQALPNLMKPPTANAPALEKYNGPLSRFSYDPSTYQPVVVNPPNPVYRPIYAAEGGLMNLAMGGQPNQMYPQSQQEHTNFATPTQMPTSAQAVLSDYDTLTSPFTGQEKPIGMNKGGNPLQELLKSRDEIDKYKSAYSSDPASVKAKAKSGDYNAMLAMNDIKGTPNQNWAQGGQLGGYSDGGRMLRGPGDGMSDSIPASISGRQPARLADGEFVVPADVVSHLGNGSTDAGAKKLYAMMDKVRQARTGKKAQARAINPNKMMPA